MQAQNANVILKAFLEHVIRDYCKTFQWFYQCQAEINLQKPTATLNNYNKDCSVYALVMFINANILEMPVDFSAYRGNIV